MNDMTELPTGLYELRADTPAPRDAWLARTRHRLLTEPRTTSHARLPGGRRWNTVRVVGVTAAIGVISAVTIGLLPVTGNDSGGQFGSDYALNNVAAAAVLREAADNAENATLNLTWEAIDNDKYVYSSSRVVEVRSAFDDDPSRPLNYREERLTENWEPVSGKGPELLRFTVVKREAISSAAELKKAGIDLEVSNEVKEYPQERTAERSGEDRAPSESGDAFDNPTLTELANLPTDPNKLLGVLEYKHANREWSIELGSGIGAFLRFGPLGEAIKLLRNGDVLIKPELRKALFLAAAEIEGIQRFGDVELDGRKGIALGKTAGGVQSEMVIDPEQSRLLGFRTVVISDARDAIVEGQPKGTVLRAESTRSTIVDQPGETE
ncbi:MAG: CU044_5270 family protein [Mycobacteriales bacterium]